MLRGGWVSGRADLPRASLGPTWDSKRWSRAAVGRLLEHWEECDDLLPACCLPLDQYTRTGVKVSRVVSCSVFPIAILSSSRFLHQDMLHIHHFSDCFPLK